MSIFLKVLKLHEIESIFQQEEILREKVFRKNLEKSHLYELEINLILDKKNVQ